MDPYAVLKYENLCFKSHVHKDGGKKPKWQDFVHEFPINVWESEIHLDIMDKDVIVDDLIGKTSLLVENLIVKGGVNNWFDIYFKD